MKHPNLPLKQFLRDKEVTCSVVTQGLPYSLHEAEIYYITDQHVCQRQRYSISGLHQWLPENMGRRQSLSSYY